METMLEFVTALVDVAMNVPETEIDECGAEDTGENKCDDEVSRRHGWELNINCKAQASQQLLSRETTQVKQSKEKRRHDFAFYPHPKYNRTELTSSMFVRKLTPLTTKQTVQHAVQQAQFLNIHMPTQ